ncbi:MAG: hypothetical protein JSW06_08415 [Thermoplasmatales archaeon]|nr:MAG: hypothetical protein JSW06_08415 [Thermoplasmatales archaeon]
MVEKCDGCGKDLLFLEGTIYIPPNGSKFKRGIYCKKCYNKKLREGRPVL